MTNLLVHLLTQKWLKPRLMCLSHLSKVLHLILKVISEPSFNTMVTSSNLQKYSPLSSEESQYSNSSSLISFWISRINCHSFYAQLITPPICQYLQYLGRVLGWFRAHPVFFCFFRDDDHNPWLKLMRLGFLH